MKRAALVLAIALAGCSSTDPIIDDRTDEQVWIKIGGGTYVTEITLPSGVHCVVYKDEITCDWNDR